MITKGSRVIYTVRDEASGKVHEMRGTVKGFHSPSGQPLVLFDGRMDLSRIPHHELVPEVEQLVHVVVTD